MLAAGPPRGPRDRSSLGCLLRESLTAAVRSPLNIDGAEIAIRPAIDRVGRALSFEEHSAPLGTNVTLVHVLEGRCPPFTAFFCITPVGGSSQRRSRRSSKVVVLRSPRAPDSASAPGRPGPSSPAQVSRLCVQPEWSHLGDRVEVGIVLQERSGLLDGTGGNEAIGRTADRLAPLSQRAVDLRRLNEERSTHLQIGEVTQKEVANSTELRVAPQTAQDLLQDNPRNADVFRPLDHRSGPVCFRMINPVQERNPDAGVDDDHASRRPRRIAERSPSHLTFPASRRMRRHCWRRRSSRRWGTRSGSS